MSKSPLCCDHACQVSRAERKKSPRPLEQRFSARVHTRTHQIRSKCTNTCCLWSSYVQPLARTPFSRNESGYLVDQLEDVVRNEEAAGGVLHQVEGLREVHRVLAVVDLCGTRGKWSAIAQLRSPPSVVVDEWQQRQQQPGACRHRRRERLPGSLIVNVPEAGQ